MIPLENKKVLSGNGIVFGAAVPKAVPDDRELGRLKAELAASGPFLERLRGMKETLGMLVGSEKAQGMVNEAEQYFQRVETRLSGRIS